MFDDSLIFLNKTFKTRVEICGLKRKFLPESFKTVVFD